MGYVVEKHVWECDLCGKMVTVEREHYNSSTYEPGIGKNRPPEKWGHVSVPSMENKLACKDCSEDVKAVVNRLMEG